MTEALAVADLKLKDAPSSDPAIDDGLARWANS